jgi:His-Xaa-Ser repeat protein HxsA
LADVDKKKQLITRIQISLFTLGYYKGSFDGIMGPQMRESLKKYRTDKFLPQKDVLDVELLNSLGVLAN